jgi:DNA-binding GntR family transcriptional regulator
MAAISDLPVPDDIDADYSPQYVKLARIIRAKIESGEYEHGDPLPAAALAAGYRVSAGIALHALEVLAANGYVRRPRNSGPYAVTWQADV